MNKQSIPTYILNIAQRMQPVLLEYEDKEGNWWGYTYKLDAKWKLGYKSQLRSDAEKMVKWSIRQGAYAKIIDYKWYDEQACFCNNKDYDSKKVKRVAYECGWRNHAYLVISDPVAFWLEKQKPFHIDKYKN